MLLTPSSETPINLESMDWEDGLDNGSDYFEDDGESFSRSSQDIQGLMMANGGSSALSPGGARAAGTTGGMEENSTGTSTSGSNRTTKSGRARGDSWPKSIGADVTRWYDERGICIQTVPVAEPAINYT